MIEICSKYMLIVWIDKDWVDTVESYDADWVFDL